MTLEQCSSHSIICNCFGHSIIKEMYVQCEYICMYLTIIMCSCSTDMFNHLKNWQSVANERARGRGRYSIILMRQAHELSDRLDVLFLLGGAFFSSVCLGLSFKFFYAKSSDNLIAHLTLHLNGGSFYFPKKCANFFFACRKFYYHIDPNPYKVKLK